MFSGWILCYDIKRTERWRKTGTRQSGLLAQIRMFRGILAKEWKG